MSYESLTVLIPSHSLEDLPLDLPEAQAEGLLNAFAVLWHPALLQSAGLLPRWERADDPPRLSAKSLVIVPAISRDWLACQWLDDVQATGATVISDVANRDELLSRCLESIDVPAELDPDLAADFLALGHCHLQIELLTRQMRYFSELDEARLEASTLSAARAALAGDAAAARSHLRNCFEMFLESRERFYPVDCYLVDLCLLTQATADDHWRALAASDKVISYLALASDLKERAAEDQETLQHLAQRWRDGKQEFIGGDWKEEATALLPLDLAIRQLTRGLQTFDELFGRRPTVWGRRKFGVGPQLPQLLDKTGYAAGLHFVMDDGLYPDEEQGKFRWEGCDGTIIDAISRLPLAGDSAASFLRFPLRMSESMDYDHAAIVQFARWPELRTPWLEDFHRIHRYAPVLGQFVTYSEFFRRTDTPGRLTKFKTSDYLSPHLLQSVALDEADPISRYADAWVRQHRYEELTWLVGVADVIEGHSTHVDASEELLDHVVRPGAVDEGNDPQTGFLSSQRDAARERLGRLIAEGHGSTPGCVLLNPCSFERRVVVDWPTHLPPAATDPAVISRHPGDASESLVVELPPSGFVWLPCDAGPSPRKKPGRSKAVPLAEDDLLRNEFFELGISPETGGLASLKTYGRGPNRLSQQVAFRFRHERTVLHGDDEDMGEPVKTFYTRMTRTEAAVLQRGPGIGQIQTGGTLSDPQTGELIGEFRQSFVVRRGRPLVEIELELTVHKQPEGDPWSSYYACRWAWSDSDAALTASVHQGAHLVTAERFEAPHYVEIATAELRTTILPHGLSFHRQTGPRMLDTLLVAAGETRRRFRFVVAIDEAYPLERARDCLMSTVPVAVSQGAPTRTSGWFFHLDALNVQITRLLSPLADVRSHSSQDASAAPAGAGHMAMGVRLRETEGRHRTIRLRCFRPPQSARQRDLMGRTITALTLDDDAVLVEVTPFEICDVEIDFGPSTG